MAGGELLHVTRAEQESEAEEERRAEGRERQNQTRPGQEGEEEEVNVVNNFFLYFNLFIVEGGTMVPFLYKGICSSSLQRATHPNREKEIPTLCSCSPYDSVP
jgi:hypothetical protein